MWYWNIIVISSIFLALLSTFSKKQVVKRYSFWAIIIIITIASSTRDGLGNDYPNYLRRVEISPFEVTMVEPLSTVVTNIAGYFNSPTLFFTFFSIWTILILGYVYKDLRMPQIALIILVCMPMIYFGTFNLVRQSLSAALILFASIRYSDNFKKYTVVVFFAALFHASSFFVLIFFPLLKNQKHKFIYIGITLLTVTIGHVFGLDIIAKLYGGFDGNYFIYSRYLNEITESQSGSGATILGLSLFFILIILTIDNRVLHKHEVASLNMFFLWIALINLSYGSYYLSRVAFLFIFGIPPAAVLIYKYADANIKNVVLIILFIAPILLMYIHLLNNIDNTAIVPR